MNSTTLHRCTAVLCLASLALTACSTSQSAKTGGNKAYEDVAKIMAAPNSLETVPVMPPQEDVRIGDVYLLNDSATLIRNPKWASLKIAPTVDEHYSTRPQFGQTADEYFMESPTPEGEVVSQLIAANQAVSASQPRTILIGPMASIEGRKELWRLVPPQVLALTLPPERRPDVEVAMRASAAQSYSLPQSEVLSASLTETNELHPRILDNLELVTDEEIVRIFIVSEVIYTRVISMGIRPRYTQAENRLWTEVFDRPLTGLENAATLNQQLREENLDDLPSGELRFLSVSDELILFRNTLEMPVAIGVRGISMDIDPKTGEVLQVALKNSDMVTLSIEAEEPELVEETVLTPKRTTSKLQPSGR